MNLDLIDKNTNIGYYGVPTSYSHEAMLNIFGEGYNEVNSESFEGVFKLWKKENQVRCSSYRELFHWQYFRSYGLAKQV